jgi:glycosyltransferase involved in cell wall biosynthesis
MMNVALLYLDALQGGGYPRDVRWLAGGLASAGVAVKLIARPGPHRDGLGTAITVDPPEFHSVARAADILHLWGIFSPAQFRLSRWLRPRARYVITPAAHLMQPHLRRRWWKKLPYIAAMQPVLATSPHVAHFFSETERAARASRYLRARASFDASLGLFPAFNRKEAAAAASDDYLLFFGRNDVYQKGIDILLEAYARGMRGGLGLPLLIAGQPAGGSERFIRRAIDRLGLAGRVQMLGRVSEERKWELLSGARCLVFLSRWDGPPRPIREAMATGTPVIVSPGTNLGEIVRAVGGGLCVETRLDEIAAGLLRSQDRPTARLWKSRARAYRDVLDWNRVVQQYVRGYELTLETLS